jgi:hypothetical protein
MKIALLQFFVMISTPCIIDLAVLYLGNICRPIWLCLGYFERIFDICIGTLVKEKI